MKAAICTRYGPPEVLQIQEIPKPIPKSKEMLIRVMASAVNSGDVRVRGLVVHGLMKWVMQLVLGISKPRKPILGVVFSGIVEETGDQVSHFKKGDEIMGITGFRFGAHAEFMTLPEKARVVRKPQNATFEEAAAILFGGHTAIYFLEKAGLQNLENPEVLILGGTGSVGSSAIQLARHYGARVTAVYHSRNADWAIELGAQRVIAYDMEDIFESGLRFDVVFDAVGKYNKAKCRWLCKPGGIFKSVEGLEMASESIEQLKLLSTLFEKGELKPVMDKIFHLEEIVQAHANVDLGRKRGNVVLKIGEK
jgi:NADPH:quinone reductase-like Zn-dependent oxidoreductase